MCKKTCKDPDCWKLLCYVLWYYITLQGINFPIQSKIFVHYPIGRFVDSKAIVNVWYRLFIMFSKSDKMCDKTT